MTDTQKEFFDMVKSDDVFGLTAILNEDPSLANTVNDQGTPAIMAAIYYDRPEVVKLLMLNGATIDACVASAMGNLARLEKLITADKTCIEMHSSDGWTPLHLAAYFGKKDAAKMLLDAGAPVLARSTNALKNHPLHAAIAGKGRDIAAMLLENGAEINSTFEGGFTALHAAAQSGNVEMVKMLILAGADAGHRADSGQLALDLALGQGHKPVVDLLMEAPGIQ